MNRNIFKINFDDSVEEFGYKDGIISVVYYFYVIILLYLFGLFINQGGIPNVHAYRLIMSLPHYEYAFFITMPGIILELLPIFILIKIRKQKIKSLGFKKIKFSNHCF